MLEGIKRQLKQAVIEGLPEDAEMYANQALAQGLDPLDCINGVLLPVSSGLANFLRLENISCPS